MPSTPRPISVLPTLGFMKGFSICPLFVQMLIAALLAISLAVLLPVSAGGQTVTSIAVTPSNPAVTAGQAQQFTATATYSNGSTSVLTSGPGTWATKAVLPNPRWGSAFGAINSKIVVAGGYNGSHLNIVQTYDTVTNTWATNSSKPATQTSAANGVIGGLLYTAGGTNCCVEINDLWVYDPSTDSWTTRAPLPSVRQASGGGVLNGKLHVVGGHAFSAALNLHHAYDPVTNTWTAKAPMPTPRTLLGVGVVNGILYAVGGLGTGFASVVSTVEAYDPVTDSWTTKASMPTARSQIRVEVVNGILYAIGGSNAGGALATVEAYDPVSNTWTTETPMITARSYLTSGVVNGVIYAIAGVVSTTPGSNANEAYTPAGASWSSSNPSVATVSNSGLATGLAVGSTTISATSGSISGSTTLTVVAANQPPIANAGPNQTVAATSPSGAAVTLNGSASSDPNGDPLTYTWTGSFGTVSGVNPPVTLAVGTHTISLTVYDGYATATSSVIITVTPAVLTSIAVTPADPTIYTGQTQPFTATGTFSDGSSSVLTSGGTWASKAVLPNPRWGSAFGAINGKIVVAGGYNGSHLNIVQTYDTVTNTWATNSSKPATQTSAANGVIGGLLYTAGGTNCCVEINDLWVYDPSTDSWAPRAPLPSVRQASGGGVLSGKLHVVGGHAFSAVLNLHHAYDPVTNTWTAKAPMPTPRTLLGVGVVNGILYAVGGLGTGFAGVVGTVEAYDPATDTWTTRAGMPTARSQIRVEVVNGILYAIGGSNAGGALATVEAYDPVSNTWTTETPMTTARGYLTSGVVNGVIYAIGGVVSTTPGSNANEAFTPALNSVTWNSGDSAVATVSANGIATGVSPGSTSIRATSGSISGSTTLTVEDPNHPPVADAGADQTVEALSSSGALVTLNGSASTDPDGDTLTYTWTGPFGTVSGVSPGVTLPLGTSVITLTVDDGHGHSSTATTDVTVVDTTPPAVSCGAADGVWHGSDVSIACTASDLVGLATPGDASFSLSTSVAAGVETSNAGTASRNVCDTSGNCVTAGPIGGNRVDKKGPSITINTPASGGSYVLNQLVASSYACTDGGSGMGTCAGTVANGSNFNTATVGSQSLTVTATDSVGNTATLVRTYDVVYSIGACLGSPSHQILQPINVNGTSVFKKGSVVPTKFRVCDANGSVISTAGVVTGFVQVASVEGTVTEIDEQVYSNTPDNGFRWDATSQQWIFNLDTKNNPTLTAGSTYVFRIYLLDGTFIQYQFGLK